VSAARVNNAFSIGLSCIPTGKSGFDRSALLMLPLAMRIHKGFLCGGLGVTPAVYQQSQFINTGPHGMGHDEMTIKVIFFIAPQFGLRFHDKSNNLSCSLLFTPLIDPTGEYIYHILPWAALRVTAALGKKGIRI
jgi:hypothetical protein